MWISSRHCRSSFKRAFTLIELLVVVAIISIITLVLVLQQSKFNSSTVLRSLAYSVALSVRQTQVYGVSVIESAPGSNTFATGYGLYFSAPGSYILFADANSNGVYDAGEELKTFSLNPGYQIAEVCAISGTTYSCSGPHDTSGARISSLTILFHRPNPDACFATNLVADCAPKAPAQFDSGWVGVASKDGTVRGILVYSTGQISVQPPNAAP